MTSPIQTVGKEFDYLATHKPEMPPAFPAPANKRLALVVTVRNEGLGLLEWIAHHRLIGVDGIFLYTNANTDGSDALLEALARAGVIALRHNVVAKGLSPQLKAYRHALWFCDGLKDYEWAAFIDADEFLFPAIDGQTVSAGSWLDHIESKYDCSAIYVNWYWLSGDVVRREPGLVMERFRVGRTERHFKTVCRLRDVSDISIHTQKLFRGQGINGMGEVRTFRNDFPKDGGYALGRLNHYWNKSFEEYYVKRTRGRGARHRELRDWHTYHAINSGQRFAETDIPTPDHFDAVRQEMERLRALPGVARAEQAVLDRHRAQMARVPIERLYEEAKTPPAVPKPKTPGWTDEVVRPWRRFLGHVKLRKV